MRNRARFFVSRNPSRRGTEIWFSGVDHEGEYVLQSQKVRINPIDENGFIDPTIFISDDLEEISSTMQGLFDELWQLGYRPRGLSKVEADAQSKHLADMRKIVSKFLEIEL